jgi:hypothetical protein
MTIRLDSDFAVGCRLHWLYRIVIVSVSYRYRIGIVSVSYRIGIVSVSYRYRIGIVSVSTVQLFQLPRVPGLSNTINYCISTIVGRGVFQAYFKVSLAVFR